MLVREQVEAMAKILNESEQPGQVFAEFIATVLITTNDPAGNWSALQDTISFTIAEHLACNKKAA